MALALQSRSCHRLGLVQPRPNRFSSRTVLVVRRYKNGDDEQADDKAKVVFQLPHHVEWGQDMCLVGETEALGAWDVDHCLPMSWHDGDVWTAEAELPKDTEVQYKYIVREGKDGDECVKDVHEWQPCMNLELQVQGSLQEVTVRDAWEGHQHEVLPGILPLPVPPPPPASESEALSETEPAPAPFAEEPPALTPTPAAAAAADPEPAPASPAVAAAVDRPAGLQAVGDAVAVEVEDLVGSSDEADAAAVLPASASPDSAVVVTAEQIAAATPDHPQQAPGAPAAAGAAAPAAPAVLAGGAGGVPGAAHDSVHAGTGNIQQHIREVRHQDATVPAWLKKAPRPQAADDDFDSLATSELQDLCKQRGLPSKGPRSQLLARLQHNKA